MNDSSSAPTKGSTGPAWIVMSKVICPSGHEHDIAKDANGWDVYGFLLIFGMPCKFNRFRLRTVGV